MSRWRRCQSAAAVVRGVGAAVVMGSSVRLLTLETGARRRTHRCREKSGSACAATRARALRRGCGARALEGGVPPADGRTARARAGRAQAQRRCVGRLRPGATRRLAATRSRCRRCQSAAAAGVGAVGAAVVMGAFCVSAPRAPMGQTRVCEMRHPTTRVGRALPRSCGSPPRRRARPGYPSRGTNMSSTIGALTTSPSVL